MTKIHMLMAFLGGLTIYLTAPILMSVVSASWAESQAEKRMATAANALRRGIMVMRQGGPQLVASRFDQAAGEEGCKLDGTSQHFVDPGGKMTTLYGRPFGVADEVAGVFLTPRDAEIGEVIRDHRERDDWTYRDASGTDWQRGYLSLPKGPRLVWLPNAVPMIDGSADPGLATRIREIIETMQAPYDSSSHLEYLPWAIGFGVGIGAVLIGAKVVSNAGGGGPDGGGIIFALQPLVGVLL